jgi:hypothetical protein
MAISNKEGGGGGVIANTRIDGSSHYLVRGACLLCLLTCLSQSLFQLCSDQGLHLHDRHHWIHPWFMNCPKR